MPAWETSAIDAVQSFRNSLSALDGFEAQFHDLPENDRRILSAFVAESFNSAQTQCSNWSAHTPESDIFEISRFHAYRRATSALSFLVKLRIDLSRWTTSVGALQHDDAQNYRDTANAELVGWLLLLGEVHLMNKKRPRLVPMTAELVTGMEATLQSRVFPIREVVNGWTQSD